MFVLLGTCSIKGFIEVGDATVFGLQKAALTVNSLFAACELLVDSGRVEAGPVLSWLEWIEGHTGHTLSITFINTHNSEPPVYCRSVPGSTGSAPVEEH